MIYTANEGTALSPRTRGWTVKNKKIPKGRKVVPAHAGVDRTQRDCNQQCCRCPRARGGGPIDETELGFQGTLSPRTRGWTEKREGRQRQRNVVPAHAGVDRNAHSAAGTTSNNRWRDRHRVADEMNRPRGRS